MSVAELARRRGEDLADTRMWLARQVGDRALITVPHDGRAIVPAFQFTAVGTLRPKLRPLLDALVPGGVDGWQLWTCPKLAEQPALRWRAGRGGADAARACPARTAVRRPDRGLTGPPRTAPTDPGLPRGP